MQYYQDMVIEEQVPDIGTLGVSLLKTVEPRRPLKPARTQRKKAASQNLTEGSVTILVSVVRAYNLPTRDKQQMQNTGSECTILVLNICTTIIEYCFENQWELNWSVLLPGFQLNYY